MNHFTTPTTERIPRLVTIRQAAATGILSESAIRRMVKTGEIASIQTGNRALINLDSLIRRVEAM